MRKFSKMWPGDYEINRQLSSVTIRDFHSQDKIIELYGHNVTAERFEELANYFINLPEIMDAQDNLINDIESLGYKSEFLDKLKKVSRKPPEYLF